MLFGSPAMHTWVEGLAAPLAAAGVLAGGAEADGDTTALAFADMHGSLLDCLSDFGVDGGSDAGWCGAFD